MSHVVIACFGKKSVSDCAPFLANLFLFSYENEWMMRMKSENPHLARQFSNSVRYIDDLFTINNDGLMKTHMNEIHPKELELKHENSECDKNASYLDLHLEVINSEIVTSHMINVMISPSKLLTSLIYRVTSQGMDHMVYS